MPSKYTGKITLNATQTIDAPIPSKKTAPAAKKETGRDLRAGK